MKRKRVRKILLYIIIIVSCWLVFAQVGMSYRTSDANAKKSFEKKGIQLFTDTIDAGGFKLHYAKTGNDTLPTLFFVHGSPGSWTKFEEYLEDQDLLKKFRLISVDRPGFGFSEFGVAKNLADQSTIISLLLKKIQNNKPVYAIGRSYGGPLIVQLAADNPGIFSGMVLLASAIDPDAEKPEKWRKILLSTPLNYFIPGAWKQANKEIWYLKNDLKVLAPGFASITCPVHIMHGDKDSWVPVSNVDYARKMLVNASSVSVTIVPGGGHYVSQYNFEKVKEILFTFQ